MIDHDHIGVEDDEIGQPAKLPPNPSIPLVPDYFPTPEPELEPEPERERELVTAENAAVFDSTSSLTP